MTMLMRFNGPSLGMIPAWQFSEDPTVNPKINPHVKYPAGIYQTTPQPIGPYYQGPESGVAGPRVVLNGLGITNPFDSWWWTNRKWVALGFFGLLGAGLFVGATAILR